MKIIQRLVIALCVAALPIYAVADYTATQGAGTTVFAFVCFVSKVCPTHTNVTSTGTEIFTLAVPGQVTLSASNVGISGTVAATQSGNWSFQPGNVTVTNTTGQPVNVLDANSVALLAAAQAGTATYGSANPSSGISNGLDALSSEQTKATTGNIISAMGDLVGKQVTSPYANRENFLSCAVTITDTSGHTCTGMGAQGASVKIYVTDFACTRNDAGTTAISATLGDASTTIVDLPNNGGGGGFSKTYNVPLVIAANTAFTLTMSNSITSVHCSASGFKGY